MGFPALYGSDSFLRLEDQNAYSDAVLKRLRVQFWLHLFLVAQFWLNYLIISEPQCLHFKMERIRTDWYNVGRGKRRTGRISK